MIPCRNLLKPDEGPDDTECDNEDDGADEVASCWGCRPSARDFVRTLQELQRFTVIQVEAPAEARSLEVQSLCDSIFATERLEKSIRKMKATLAEIEDLREAQMKEKTREKDQLVQLIRHIRQESRTTIGDLRKGIADRLQVSAWKSHARQTKVFEEVARLQKELSREVSAHASSETLLRHQNDRLQSEVQAMIDRYDQEMFQLHEDLDLNSVEYTKEKEALGEALKALDAVQRRKEALIEEKRLEEEAERDAELMRIRRNISAKVIQRAWRSYKARQLLKSRKKHRKKRN